MRASSLLTVLSTFMLFDSTVSEPIPIYAKTQNEGGVHLAKRMEAKAFEKNGWGDRYWAWSRVPYDYDWNSNMHLRPLKYSKDKDGNERDWKLLKDWKINIRGTAGDSYRSDFELPDGGQFQGGGIDAGGSGQTDIMNAIVAVDHQHNEIVVAFKGTDDMVTVLQDLKAFRNDPSAIAGKTERGFTQSFESVHESVGTWLDEHVKELSNDAAIVFAGHSLGGATALIAASYFVQKWNHLKDRVWVFTYGAPRAGNQEFQEYLQKELGDRVYNFVHHHDPVPHMPPQWNGYSNPAGRYQFEPKSQSDSWYDMKKWTHTASADKDKAGYLDTAKDASILMNPELHTGYFQDDRVKVKRDPGEQRGSVYKHHNKRQAPTEEELARATDYVDKLKQNADLRDPKRDVPDAMWNIGKVLHFEDDVPTVWGDIQKEDTEAKRIAHLNVVILVAGEHA